MVGHDLGIDKHRWYASRSRMSPTLVRSTGEESTAEGVFVGSSEMAALMRATDWSATPLGPVTGWPQSLRAAVRLMLTSRFPMWLGWGEQLTFFYNDAYGAMTLGAKHPGALGQPFSVIWREIWSELAPRIERVLSTGIATWDESLLLFLERSGYPEETYHTFSYSPVHDDGGVIRGNFCVVTEETERVIGERRLALLKQLAEQLTSANTTSEVCSALSRALATDARDIPFSLSYLVNGASNGAGKLALASRTGIAADHPALAVDGGASVAAVPLVDAVIGDGIAPPLASATGASRSVSCAGSVGGSCSAESAVGASGG